MNQLEEFAEKNRKWVLSIVADNRILQEKNLNPTQIIISQDLYLKIKGFEGRCYHIDGLEMSWCKDLKGMEYIIK